MDNGASSYRRYLEGEEEAFDEIMNELFDKLVFFIDRYVRDVQASEDIAIDVFTDLVVHKKRYDFRVTLKTYVFMIGRSRALTYIKRRRRHASLSDIGETVTDPSADAAFVQSERQMLVHRALADLPEDMRAAIHLVYFEGLSYEEAAAVMKKNKKQIDNLIYRAKGRLRESLGEEVLM